MTLLKSMPLFEQCSDEQLHNTAMFMFNRKYEKGQVIAKEGDECQNIYLMEAGEVELRQDVRVVTSPMAQSSESMIALFSFLRWTACGVM